MRNSSAAHDTTALLRWFVAITVLLPAVLLGAAAWHERTALLEEARSTAEHTVLALLNTPSRC